MVKSKKILSLALALVMALGVLTMGVFAAKTTPTATFTVSASASEVANGDEVTITVKANATETFYAGPMSLPIEYDASLFEYVADSAAVANIYGAGTTKSAVKAEAGKLTVALTPSTSGAVTAPDLNGANLTVLTFKLKAIGSTGSSTVAIANDQKTDANIGGKFYCGSFDSANPKTAELTEIGQTLNRVDTTISYKSAAAPADLQLAASAQTGIIIDTNKTFGGQYAGVVFGFVQTAGNTFMTNKYLQNNLEASNGGTLEFARPNGKTSGGFGTGTTVTVKNSDGSDTGKVYVVVIFGDVNQDGMITAADTTIVKGWATKPATAPANNTVLRMAANTAYVANATVLHNIQTNDTTALKNYVTKNAKATTDLAKLNPVKLAEAQAKYNNFYQ